MVSKLNPTNIQSKTLSKHKTSLQQTMTNNNISFPISGQKSPQRRVSKQGSQGNISLPGSEKMKSEKRHSTEISFHEKKTPIDNSSSIMALP